MTSKPKIQYVGQFYVYGSEAQVLQQDTENRSWLPNKVFQKMEKLYLDPVALIAIALAIFLLAAMVVGVLEIQKDWAEYQYMAEYLHTVREENHSKTQQFRESFDRAELRAKAESMGMIPKVEAQQKSITVTLPQPKAAPTFLERTKWFVKGLFA